MRTVVLGLGNPIVADDRAGLAVAQAVARLLREAPVAGAEVRESTRGGFELIDLLSGFERAMLVDCIITGDPQPGRIHELTREHVEGSARLLNTHELSIGEAFRIAGRLDIPMPAEVLIFGVEGADTTTLTEEMSPEVAAAVEPLARRMHTLLRAAL